MISFDSLLSNLRTQQAQPQPSATLSQPTPQPTQQPQSGGILGGIKDFANKALSFIGKQPIFNSPPIGLNNFPTTKSNGPTIGETLPPLVQSPLRTAANIELSTGLGPMNNPYVKAGFKTPIGTKISQLAFGDTQPQSFQSQAKKGVDVPFVGNIKGNAAYVPLLAGAAIDLTPLTGSGEKLAAEEAIKLAKAAKTAEEFKTALQTAPEATKGVLNVLQNKKIPVNTIEDFWKNANAGGGQDVWSTISQAIDQSGQLRKEQATLTSAERSARFKQAEAAFQTGSGKQGALAGLSKLGGQYEKVKMNPIQLDPAVQDMAYEAIAKADIPTTEKASAIEAMNRIINGHDIPTNTQLAALQRVAGPEVVQKITEAAGLGSIRSNLAEVANLPRTLMSTADISAPGRQGIFLAPSHPKDFLRSFKNMFGYAFSEQKFNNFYNELEKRPTFQAMQDAGLNFTRPDAPIAQREEYFMSNLAERIPYLGALVRGSNRAYTGFLNNLRADAFDTMYKSVEKAGLQNDVKTLRDLGGFVDNATGRGDLRSLNKLIPGMGDKLAESAPLLNSVFFAPRLIASRLNLINPIYYAKLSPPVRKEAVKSAVAFAIGGMTALGMAKLAGADVSTDINSPDFGKIKIGNTRYDIWGGFQQYVRFIGREALAINKVYNGTLPYNASGPGEIAGKFARGKLGPDASFAVDLWLGKDYSGKKLDFTSTDINTNPISSRLIPFILQDMKDALDAYGPLGPIMAIPSLWGTGTQTYSSTSSLGIGTKLKR